MTPKRKKSRRKRKLRYRTWKKLGVKTTRFKSDSTFWEKMKTKFEDPCALGYE